MASLPQLSPVTPGAYPRASPPGGLGLSPPPSVLARQQGFALPHRHHPYPDTPSRIMDPSKGIHACAPFPVNSLPVESLVAPPDSMMYSNPGVMKAGMSLSPSMCALPPYDIHGSYQYLSQAYASLDPRRKNATKESTNTLKAWLYEHKKNPYPTKGEKIMLAILTRMTLTQVSTWFANARRRLKKERGGWTGEDDDDEEEEEVEVEKEEEADEEEARLRGKR
ncbi:hypothetical protein CAPTEDRAFT_168300 [Capitella teleta]|uniref:Homeobox domain-containing protein n=1 Tax=Capitella teleta TaxID=283909 RepID=R7U8T2_CAPTE|nr:hypothetical protein CAPTEDRAFT_168300 [Capitella teleta]|eukprot:ELU00107.1 hypothetical protein CAPTEDRAFT_168300 [Capitella teleta]